MPCLNDFFLVLPWLVCSVQQVLDVLENSSRQLQDEMRMLKGDLGR